MTTITSKRKGVRPVTRVVDIREQQIAHARTLPEEVEVAHGALPPLLPRVPQVKGHQPAGARLQSVVGSLRTAAEHEKLITDDERAVLKGLAEKYAARAKEVRAEDELDRMFT